MMKRLLPLPVVFALFFGPLHTGPSGTGTAAAAGDITAEAQVKPGQPALQEEPEGEDKDTPWAVILPLAFGIPLAVLFVPAILRRRGGGH